MSSPMTAIPSTVRDSLSVATRSTAPERERATSGAAPTPTSTTFPEYRPRMKRARSSPPLIDGILIDGILICE